MSVIILEYVSVSGVRNTVRRVLRTFVVWNWVNISIKEKLTMKGEFKPCRIKQIGREKSNKINAS